MNFQITIAIAYVIAHITLIILIGFLLYTVVFIFPVIHCIIGAIAMSNGQHYR